MSVQTGYQTEHNHVHFLRVKKAYSDITSGTQFSLGWVPAGAVVLDAGAHVDTAFNSGTSDVLDIGFRNSGDGTTADDNEYMSAVSIASVGNKKADDIATAGDCVHPKGAEITAKWTAVGAAATAGVLYAWCSYIVDNDGDTTS